MILCSGLAVAQPDWRDYVYDCDYGGGTHQSTSFTSCNKWLDGTTSLFPYVVVKNIATEFQTTFYLSHTFNGTTKNVSFWVEPPNDSFHPFQVTVDFCLDTSCSSASGGYYYNFPDGYNCTYTNITPTAQYSDTITGNFIFNKIKVWVTPVNTSGCVYDDAINIRELDVGFDSIELLPDNYTMPTRHVATYWQQENFDPSQQRSSGAVGDFQYGSYYWLNFTAPTDYGGEEPIVADFQSGNDNWEMVVWGDKGLAVYDANFSIIDMYSVNNISSSYSMQGISATDWNNDGIQDIFILYTSTTTGFVSVLQFQGNDLHAIFNDSITKETHHKRPNCYGDYCYVIDDHNILHRWDIDTEIEETLALGSLADEENYAWITIDDCDETNDGFELATFGDLDNDGYHDMIILIHIPDGGSMSVMRSQEVTGELGNPEITSPLACGKPVGMENRTVYVAMRSYSAYYSSPCLGWRYTYLMAYEGKNFNKLTRYREETSCNACSYTCYHYGDLSSPQLGIYEGEVYSPEYIYIESSDDQTNERVRAIDPLTMTYPGAIEWTYVTSTNYNRYYVPLTVFDADNDGNSEIVHPQDGDIVNAEDGTNLLTLTYTGKSAIVVQDGISYADLVLAPKSGSTYRIYTDGWGTNISAGDSLPNFISQTPYPNPQNINENVGWQVQLGDDSPAGTQTMAFDCENDGVLDYAWDDYGGLSALFNCTYPTQGIKTSKAWASDIYHNTTNSSNTAQVTIVESGVDYNCSNFTAPICVGDCWLYDNFQYSADIQCNGWSGIARTPFGNEILYLTLMNSTDRLIYDGTSSPIRATEYDNFTMSFDFINNDYRSVYLYLRQTSGAKLISYIYFNSNEAHVVDQTVPTNELLCTYSDNETVHVSILCDLQEEECLWTCKSNTETMDFYDIGVTYFGYLLVEWDNYNNVDFFLDNVSIDLGSTYTDEVSEEVNVTEGVSYLTTGNFCAIDWEAHEFVEEECDDRGYSTINELTQMCLIRACISDTFTYIYTKARLNVFKTIIIILAIILLAPLVIMIGRRKKK